ncbi:MAG: hypothetical protein V5A28_01780 [Haloarculaceae archaeon]
MSFGDSDERLEAVEVTHSPATVSSTIAAAAAVLAVITSGTSVLGLVVGVFGLVAVLGGLFVFESERALLVGTAFVFLGVVVSGVYGNSLALLVMGTFGSILAFDVGSNAFSVGRQMSDDTQTTRGEVVHASASLAVGVVIVGIGTAVFLVGLTGLPIASLALLLFGALLLTWAIRT